MTQTFVNQIVDLVLSEFPETQAIYLFGTYGTEYQRPDSDVDIALLLPYEQAINVKSFAMHPLHTTLEQLLHRNVDLINGQLAPTMLQKEIIAAERRIYCANEHAAIEFEVFVIRKYQELRMERADIIHDALETGRFIK